MSRKMSFGCDTDVGMMPGTEWKRGSSVSCLLLFLTAR